MMTKKFKPDSNCDDSREAATKVNNIITKKEFIEYEKNNMPDTKFKICTKDNKIISSKKLKKYKHKKRAMIMAKQTQESII